MSLTLLLDLDDTLLANDIDVFLPAYLSAFAEYVSNHIDPQIFIPAILQGTKQMVENERPDLTLQQVFFTDFFARVDVEEDEFLSIAAEFYEIGFPKLRGLTEPLPGVCEFVESAIQRGYRVAITTNPLFPRSAILQRIEWAGLSDYLASIALVSSFETFHFSKPNPAFYGEVLGRLGWPEGPVVVAGDDLENDITAGGEMGLSTYWVWAEPPDNQRHSALADGEGSISELLPWLERQEMERLTPDFQSITAMLATMRSAPAVIDSLLHELKEELWITRPAPEEWCPTEIICHFRDVDRFVNLPRIRAVLDAENPFLAAEDTDQWAEEQQYICQDGELALKEFNEQRSMLLDTLSTISEGDWQRPARHSIFGRTDLRELVGIIAGHDRLHIEQLYGDLESMRQRA